MAAASQSPWSDPPADRRLDSRRAPSESGPRLAYRAVLARYKRSLLAEIRLKQGAHPGSMQVRPAASADEITDYLDQPAAARALIARLSLGARLALCLFAVTESTSMRIAGLLHALGILGVQPVESVVELVDLGLLAIWFESELRSIDHFPTAVDRAWETPDLVFVHPGVASVTRTTKPDARLPGVVSAVSQVRESDGLELVLRLGALWQRVGFEPLRQTQQGVLYKRDRERIAEDPVLAAPFSDAFEPVNDPAAFLLALASRVGVIERDPTGERLLAAGTAFWEDNAVHLPQMIATGWMSLQQWQELGGDAADRAEFAAVRYLRTAVLLWLATLDDSEWVSMDDLAEHLSAVWPAWKRPFLTGEPVGSQSPKRKSGSRDRPRPPTLSARQPQEPDLLSLLLRGTAHSLGLVREAEDRSNRRRVVQLTALGRYVLALGPSPPPHPSFEHFLFVQPNFELIAYRQGLTNQLIGRLSRFAWWAQIGAALELKLTRESILHGLENGQTAATILETLRKHSQRPVPHNIEDAITNWAGRREHVTYYAAASLIEFNSRRERDLALTSWPASNCSEPIVVSDRFLLVEDEKSVPFDRLRQTSSRDYRRPPEICAMVEPDGVTVTLDPARSDLLVDAELVRFADELPSEPAVAEKQPGPPPRRFVVTVESLRRGLSRGMTAAQVAEWYARRTGGEIPPAVRLLLAIRSSQVPTLQPVRILVLTLSSAELLDGLLQHPEIQPWLGDRLGPNSVTIADECVDPLQKALHGLGIRLDAE